VALFIVRYGTYVYDSSAVYFLRPVLRRLFQFSMLSAIIRAELVVFLLSSAYLEISR